jgi:hypothetical protein
VRAIKLESPCKCELLIAKKIQIQRDHFRVDQNIIRNDFFLENGTESKVKSKLEKTLKELIDKKENMTSTLLTFKKEEYLKEFP